MAERISTGLANSILEKWAADFTNGVLEIYSGIQPASSNDTELGNGTLLVVITNGGLAFTGGQPTNGLNFGTPVAGGMDKAAAEVWKGTVLVNGTAGWYRFYDNSYTKGASTTAKRFDGAVSTSVTAELQLINTTLVQGGELTLGTFPVSQPVA